VFFLIDRSEKKRCGGAARVLAWEAEGKYEDQRCVCDGKMIDLELTASTDEKKGGLLVICQLGEANTNNNNKRGDVKMKRFENGLCLRVCVCVCV
jgi:hypothetical protein